MIIEKRVGNIITRLHVNKHQKPIQRAAQAVAVAARWIANPGNCLACKAIKRIAGKK